MKQTLFDQMKNAKNSSPFEPQVLSVSEFYTYVNNLLGLEEVIVEGEISKVDVFKGYLVYLSINDKDNVLPCLVYKNKLDVLGLSAEVLEPGTTVQVRGVPNIYSKRGEFKLLVEKISLVGEGALRKAFEVLKKKLENEGLFSQAVKRPIPEYPQTIGVITSRGAAAYTDFIKVLQARWGGLKIMFHPASVQGEGAVQEILQAFDYFNANVSHLDALVLTRGGGSLEDLAAFNAEAVVRAVRSSKWPVICAVGHERDESLADFAADLRASTPSNAAELLVPTRQEESQFIESFKRKIILHMESKVVGERQYIERSLSIMEAFFQKPKTELIALQEHLERSVNAWIENMKQNISQKERLLKSFDPQAVLKRGYSITTTKQGTIVKLVRQVKKGEEVKTAVSDGAFTSSVTNI